MISWLASNVWEVAIITAALLITSLIMIILYPIILKISQKLVRLYIKYYERVMEHD